ISNNIANMSTPGYRGHNMVFSEYVEKLKGNPDPLSLVNDYGNYQITDAGPLKQTGNQLDVAVQGEGYFGIQTADGVMYTRAGNFQVNNNGDLVDGRGRFVAGVGGGNITIPPGVTDIEISEDGFISTPDGQVGQLMVVEFENIQELEAQGNGLYKTDAAANPPVASRVMQGMLEGSNVNPITEMTRMIEVSRAYQSNYKLMQAEHDRQRGMIQKLTQS
ncbi:MAG: flagellar basal-body rod protein FlgF, partial [Alphaproteobacteria bacterium]|nr:flagellar basal-body rod protein FlgF [Alphaproteobacteria bacterium]